MIESIDLIGTWQFTRDGAQAFIHFTHTQAFDYMEDSAGHQILRLWYVVEEPDTIRFRNRPEEAGWICGVKFEGESLVISGADSETAFTKAHAENIPAWFAKEIESYSKPAR